MSIISPICGTKRKNKFSIASNAKKTHQYKGFTINYIGGEYRADAYGNPQFTDTNLAKLKSKINKYLRS